MKVYSQLEVASLENLASDPTLLPEGRIWFNTTSGLVKIRIGGATKVLLRDDLAQIANYANTGALPAAGNAGRIAYLTDSKKLFFDNGTAWGPIVGIVGLSATASDNIKLHRSGVAKMQLVPGSDATADGSVAASLAQFDSRIANYADIASLPSPGNAGRLAYVAADGKLYRDDGTSWSVASGSGSGGGINYITNPDAETDTTGWATYADAAAVTPVDGTGGSPNITWTRSTSSPLRGVASFLLTKDAVNRQGQGVSYAFTIHSADQAKVLQGSFDYAVASGTFADDAVRFYVYDVTNATMQQVVPYLLKNVSTPSEKFGFEFQTAVNSTSYRFIIHVAGTDASAYTLKFENFAIGPTAKLYGSPVTDWQTFTPTGSWVTNTTYAGRWRRVGDEAEIQYYVTTSGAPTATTLTLNLPSGLTIDSNKVVDGGSAQRYDFGWGRATQSGATWHSVKPIYNSATSLLLRADIQSTSGYDDSGVANNFPYTFAAGGSVMVFAKVPVAGWGSSLLMSNDADVRVCAFRVQGTPSGTLVGAFNDVTWASTAAIDTHGGYNGSTTYTVKVPGTYRVTALSQINGTFAVNQSFQLRIVKNGSQEALGSNRAGGAITNNFAQVSALVNCVVGDTIKIQAFAESSTNSYVASASLHEFTVERLTGPAQITASEKVYAEYGNSAGTSITGADATNIIPFATKFQDTHNAWSTNVFTAPRSDFYSVKLYLNILSLANATRVIVSLQKNGSNFRRLVSARNSSGGALTLPNQSMTTSIYLLAGETLRFNAQIDDATTRALEGSTDVNWFVIESQRGV